MGKLPCALFIIVGRERELLQVVDALRTPSRPRGRTAPPGKSSEIKTAMMAITTSNSMSVKPRRLRDTILDSPSSEKPFWKREPWSPKKINHERQS